MKKMRALAPHAMSVLGGHVASVASPWLTGETGRHANLKHSCRKASRFESGVSYLEDNPARFAGAVLKTVSGIVSRGSDSSIFCEGYKLDSG